MHVAIDYTAAVRQQAGIGRYTRNLVRNLADVDARNQYTLFVAGGWGQGDGLGAWPPNFRVRAVPVTDRVLNIVWQRLRIPLPIQIVTGRFDLFHAPDFVLPYVANAPALLTVHDLSFLRVPQHFVPGFRDYLEGAVSRGVSRANHILADSESTRSDLVDLMRVRGDKVSVVYPGVESRFSRIEDGQLLAEVRERYQLPNRFVLGLSTLQPRKNFDGLVDAFQLLLSQHGDKEEMANLHLVICGGLGWMHGEIQQRVHHHGLEARVHFAGFVQDVDLPALYSLASVFAFPSWYEGFGLPVLEAMACGTPVVAADNSSLPEVVGDGGMLVDASSSDELASALMQLLSNRDLRVVLKRAGLAQAAKFTWPLAASALLATYERLPSQ
jgi:glycosyltransferase involved in cell wall biosynthesis